MISGTGVSWRPKLSTALCGFALAGGLSLAGAASATATVTDPSEPQGYVTDEPTALDFNSDEEPLPQGEPTGSPQTAEAQDPPGDDDDSEDEVEGSPGEPSPTEPDPTDGASTEPETPAPGETDPTEEPTEGPDQTPPPSPTEDSTPGPTDETSPAPTTPPTSEETDEDATGGEETQEAGDLTLQCSGGTAVPGVEQSFHCEVSGNDFTLTPGSSPRGAQLFAEGNYVLYTAPDSAAGTTDTVTITVTNSAGESATDSLVVYVGNSAPSPTQTTASPTQSTNPTTGGPAIGSGPTTASPGSPLWNFMPQIPLFPQFDFPSPPLEPTYGAEEPDENNETGDEGEGLAETGMGTGQLGVVLFLGLTAIIGGAGAVYLSQRRA